MFKKLFAVGFILAAGAATVMAAGTDTGVVKDNNGINVSGATVTYTRTVGGVTNTWTATTDVNGVYRFATGGLQTFTVIGSSPAAGTLVASDSGYVNSAAASLTVTRADTTGGIVFGNALLSITIRTTTGTILDTSTGSAIVGARVQKKRAGAIIDSAFSNGSGAYSISRVANGDTLIVTAANYLTKKAVEVLAAGTTANVMNFSLNAFGQVAGKVLNDSATGAAVKGATISLSHVVGGVVQAPFKTTTTDSTTGSYFFDSIPAHVPYQVAASAATFFSQNKPIASKIVGVDSVNFVLLTATASITGTISADSANGAPLDSAKVVLIKGAARVDSTFTNASGVYSFANDSVGVSYTVTASYKGRQTKSATGTKTIATDVVNIFLPVAIAGITGTITADSLKGSLLDSAKVVLIKGAARVDSTLTDTLGVYTFVNDSVGASYTVTASYKGRQTKSAPIVKTVATDTVNIFLPTAIAGITGTITADSANGMLLGGAKVTLTKGGVIVDSTVTNASGVYSFANDSVGVSYIVTASFNGFQTIPSAPFTKTVLTDVVNIILQPGSFKTIWVKVLSGPTSNPLANASVGFTKGSTVIGGTTNALGVFQITNAPVGLDTITVADSLFFAQQNFPTISAHSADTVTYTLTEVATGTPQRAIRGTAHKVTATGAVASGANIVFKCAGGYVFAATTHTAAPAGSWSVVGIPAAIPATGSIPVYSATTGFGLHATLPPSIFPGADTTWNPYNNAAAINVAATGTTTYNTIVFTVAGVVSVLPQVAEKTVGAPEFIVLHSGFISLKNMTEPGMVKVFNLRGQMLYNHAFEANAVSLEVPALTQGKTAFIVSVTQNRAELRKVVLMP